MWNIEIKGIPLQKQSAKFYVKRGFVRSYQTKQIIDWQAQARLQIINQLPKEYVTINTPIIITNLEFHFPPLKNWSKKKLRQLEKEVIYKETHPDLDNLQKNLLDVCNGIVWNNDAKIVEICNVRKIYSFTPKTVLSFVSVS